VRRYLLDATPLTALLFRRPAAIDLMVPWVERQEPFEDLVVGEDACIFSAPFSKA